MAVIAGFIWLLLALFGLSGVQAIVAQHAPGYPNRSQLILYIGWPSFFVVALVVCAILSNTSRAPPWLLGVLSAFSLFAVLPWLVVSGGGI